MKWLKRMAIKIELWILERKLHRIVREQEQQPKLWTEEKHHICKNCSEPVLSTLEHLDTTDMSWVCRPR